MCVPLQTILLDVMSRKIFNSVPALNQVGQEMWYDLFFRGNTSQSCALAFREIPQMRKEKLVLINYLNKEYHSSLSKCPAEK